MKGGATIFQLTHAINDSFYNKIRCHFKDKKDVVWLLGKNILFKINILFLLFTDGSQPIKMTRMSSTVYTLSVVNVAIALSVAVTFKIL